MCSTMSDPTIKPVKAGPPADAGEIARAEFAVGRRFPAEYVQLLTSANGLLANDQVALYSAEEIAERNTAYEVEKYATHWLMIGDDGGGYGVFLDLSESPARVYLSGMGVLIPSEAVLLAPGIPDWVSRGFPVKYF